MKKTCLALNIILITVVIAGAYKFIFKGSTTESSDGRIEILLNDSERNLVLTEMRAFLSSVQQINKGITNDDMTLVAEQARKSGKAAQTGMPGTLVGKLPLAFKKLGADTHAKFDQLAMNASDLGDRDHTLEQLSTLMENCISCHASYRISL